MVLNNLTNLVTLKPIKSESGVVASSYTESAALSFINGEVATSGQGKSRIELGTNGDAASATDYELTNNANISLVSIVSDTRQTNDIINCTAIFTNIGNDDVSVREIGLSCYIDSAYYLLTRKAFNTPIVLSPGNTYSIKYVLTMQNIN